MAPPTRVVVLYGGRSAEHDISCISARFVISEFDPRRYEVVPVGITHEGRWVDARRLVEGTAEGDGALPSPDLAPAGDQLGVGALLEAGDERETVVFPLLHGTMGEDGTVQGMLEVLRLPYVGAGVLASALCMDKAAAKEVLDHHGVPQGRWLTRRLVLVAPAFLDRAGADLGYPIFVKPANLGSSIGITRVTDRAGLEGAVALAGTYDDVVVLEAAVVGREIFAWYFSHCYLRSSGIPETRGMARTSRRISTSSFGSRECGSGSSITTWVCGLNSVFQLRFSKVVLQRAKTPD